MSTLNRNRAPFRAFSDKVDLVMAGLVPAIHVFERGKDVDARGANKRLNLIGRRFSWSWPVRRCAFVLLFAAGLPIAPAGAGDAGAKSGLPVPRFVSLKPDRVNVRSGPTRDHEVAWVYTHSGLPVEITAESDNWRRIRDWEGAEGWVYHSMLSGRRTALVKAKEKDALVPLFSKPDHAAEITARLQSGVLASVKHCTGSWCRIAGAGFDGWVAQERLWGVYPEEKVE